jgi:TonB family protein
MVARLYSNANGHRLATDGWALACSIAIHALILGLLSVATLRPPAHGPADAHSVSLPIQVAILRPSEASVEPVPAIAPPEAIGIGTPLPQPLPRALPQPPRPRPSAAGSGFLPDIGVGVLRDSAELPIDLRARLAMEFPRVPARLPRTQRPVTIAYPEAALREGRESRVIALIVVDADGKAADIVVTPDDAIFGHAVRDALAGASYVPAYDNGKPLRHWLALTFEFELSSGGAPGKTAR